MNQLLCIWINSIICMCNITMIKKTDIVPKDYYPIVFGLGPRKSVWRNLSTIPRDEGKPQRFQISFHDGDRGCPCSVKMHAAALDQMRWVIGKQGTTCSRADLKDQSCISLRKNGNRWRWKRSCFLTLFLGWGVGGGG